MLRLRRVFLTGDINDDSAKVLVQQLLFLEAEDPNAPVTIFINSGGGLVHSGLAILDVMDQASMPMKTVAYGRCFSIAALLLAAGTPGHRSAHTHARLMIHEPSCSYQKQTASDLMVKVDELRHTARTLEELLSARTGRSQAEIAAAVAKDRYMSVKEAVDFGLIDHVVVSTGGSRRKAAASSEGAAATAHRGTEGSRDHKLTAAAAAAVTVALGDSAAHGPELILAEEAAEAESGMFRGTCSI
jgi:ATP-dependent Clp protease protease subunit